MHRSRQWIIPTLLGLVGLGPMGSGELQAATIESVNIVSTGTVGIDSLFQVDVEVKDFDEEKGLELAVFLVAKRERNVEGDVVVDTLVIGSGYGGDVKGGKSLTYSGDGFDPAADPAVLFPVTEDAFGAQGTVSDLFSDFLGSDADASKAIVPCSEDGSETGDVLDATDGTDVVKYSNYCKAIASGDFNPFAAYRVRGRQFSDAEVSAGLTDAGTTRSAADDFEAPYYQGNEASPELKKVTVSLTDDGDVETSDKIEVTLKTDPVWRGDADSLILGEKAGGRKDGDELGVTYFVRWSSTGSEIMGELDDVHAAAAIIERDPNNNSPSLSDAVVLSGNRLAIDGDRPVQGVDGLSFVALNTDGDAYEAVTHVGKGLPYLKRVRNWHW